MRILVFLLFSFAASAQIPLYQLEYAPDSMKVIGAAADGEPIWVDKGGAKVKNSPTMTLRIQNDSIRADIKKRLNAINVGGQGVYLSLQIDSTGQIYGVNEIISDDFDKDDLNELQSLSTNGMSGHISLSDGGEIYINVSDTDADPNNEYSNLYVGPTVTGLPPKDGDIWKNTTTKKIFVRRNGLWVEIADINFSIDFDQSGNNLVVFHNLDGIGYESNIEGKNGILLEDISVGYSIGLDTNYVKAIINNTITTEPDSIQRIGNVISLRDGLGSVSVADLVNVPDSTGMIGGYGIDVSETANVFTVKADTSEVATHHDLTLKQDKLPSFTAGSVIFSNGTTLAQDNTNLFWDDSNNELEIKSIPIGSNASEQIYVGVAAATGATSATYSNFFGYFSGYGATNASSSNFFGVHSGLGATGATYSNFFGRNAGVYASNSSYSNFFGFDTGSSDLLSNNIIIGNSITLPSNTANGMNIGGVLFGSGFNSGTKTSLPILGGKIGVLNNNPQSTLHVSGDLRVDTRTGTAINNAAFDSNGRLVEVPGLPAGTVTSITATAPLIGGTITSIGSIGVDTTSATGLATQHDLTTKQDKLSGADKRIPYFTGASTLSNSDNLVFDNSAQNLGIGISSPSATIHMNKATGNRIRFTDPSAGTNYKNWQIFAGSGSDERSLYFQSLSDAGSTYDFMTWRKAINSQLISNLYIPHLATSSGTEVMTMNNVGEVYRDALKTVNGSSLFGSGNITTENPLTFSSPLSRSGNTISIQTASGTQSGALSAANWTTFNNKIGGSGAVNYFAIFNTEGTIANDAFYKSGNELFHERDVNASVYFRQRNINAGSSAFTGYMLNAYGNSWAMRMGSQASLLGNNLEFVVDAAGTPIKRMELSTSGVLKIPNLAGSGTRMLVTNNNGEISQQPIPTGTVTGTGTANQIAYFSGTGTLSSSVNIQRGSLGLIAGTDEITAGSKIITGMYGSGSLVGTYFGSEHSSGSGMIANFMDQSGSSTWRSTVPFLAARSALIVGQDGFKYMSAPAQTVTTGSNLPTQPTSKFTVANNGVVNILNLAGSGTRMVTTNATGDLGSADIPVIPQTFALVGSNIQSWGSTGTFGSGRDVGLGIDPTRQFDNNGDTRLRGAIYDSGNSAGSSGQVLTSQGSGAWIWATPISQTAGELWNDGNISAATYDFTFRKIDFGSFSQNNGVTSSTANDRITVPTAGTYEITYNCTYQVNSPTTTNTTIFQVFKNDTSIGYKSENRSRQSEVALNNLTTVNRTFTTTLSANDYIDLRYQRFLGSDSAVSIFNTNIGVKRIY